MSSEPRRPKPVPVPRPPAGSVQKNSAKMRGLPKDSPEVRLSKTLSWLLRHGASSQGLAMRPDGHVRVDELLLNEKIRSQSLGLEGLQKIVAADAKQRYSLIEEEGVWWIKANQGHSLKVEVVMQPIAAVTDIPSGIAVHGTTLKAWSMISKQGLSKMTRNHIHLAQGLAGDNVISGMRRSCQIFIYVDVQKALDDGIKFLLSDNGVVLTPGNEKGILEPQYFSRVEDAKQQLVTGWQIT